MVAAAAARRARFKTSRFSMALRLVLGETVDAGSEPGFVMMKAAQKVAATPIRTSAQKRDAPFFVCGSDE